MTSRGRFYSICGLAFATLIGPPTGVRDRILGANAENHAEKHHPIVGNVLIVEGIPGVGKDLDDCNFAIRDDKLCVPSLPGFGIITFLDRASAPNIPSFQ